jgi:hypothetical protein
VKEVNSKLLAIVSALTLNFETCAEAKDIVPMKDLIKERVEEISHEYDGAKVELDDNIFRTLMRLSGSFRENDSTFVNEDKVRNLLKVALVPEVSDSGFVNVSLNCSNIDTSVLSDDKADEIESLQLVLGHKFNVSIEKKPLKLSGKVRLDELDLRKIQSRVNDWNCSLGYLSTGNNLGPVNFTDIQNNILGKCSNTGFNLGDYFNVCGPDNCGPNDGACGPDNCGPNDGACGPDNCGPNDGACGPDNFGLNDGACGPDNCGPNDGACGPDNCGPNDGACGPDNCGPNDTACGPDNVMSLPRAYNPTITTPVRGPSFQNKIKGGNSK